MFPCKSFLVEVWPTRPCLLHFEASLRLNVDNELLADLQHAARFVVDFVVAVSVEQDVVVVALLVAVGKGIAAGWPDQLQEE